MNLMISFGQLVGRRRLAGEEESPRRHVEAGVVPQPVVQHDNAQRIEQLSFVFVDALDLAIENGIRVDNLARRGFEPIGKMRFGVALGLAERVAESFVVGERLELAQLAEIGHPPVADRVGDRAGERRVRQQQPAARGDAVGLVVEALGKHLGEIFDRHRAQ